MKKFKGFFWSRVVSWGLESIWLVWLVIQLGSNMCFRRQVREFQCFQRRNRMRIRRVVLVMCRCVFMRGVMKLVMVDMNISSMVMSVRIMLMNLFSSVCVLVFFMFFSCIICCCCCCSFSLVIWVRQDFQFENLFILLGRCL